ncbi:MAG: POTRA domain-containing protein, partial [Candidatus Acidiferrales bacterium]
MRTPWKSLFSRACSRYWGNAATKFLGAGALVCVLAACPSVYAQENQIEGQRVGEIRILDESGHPVTVKSLVLPFEVGKPFDFGAERESLRVLYRTGDFADIRVTALPADGGLGVNFVVRRNFYNNVVRVGGLKEPPSEAAAQAAMRLSLGDPFRESSLREALARLKDTLRNEGLYQADVKWTLTPHEDTRQMDVLVTVLPGPRAVVGNFNVKNNTPYKDAELILRSKVKLNKPLTSARLTRASQKLKKYLVDQGYLGAGILITAGTYNAQTNLVTLNYE